MGEGGRYTSMPLSEHSSYISYFTGHVRRSDPGPVHAWQGGGAGGSQEEQPHVVAYKVNIIGNYEHNTRKTKYGDL